MNKHAIEVMTLFVLLAMALSTYVFLYKAEQLVSHDEFYKNVAASKLKLTKDAIDGAPGNIIYRYYENLSSYEISFENGAFGINDYLYYPIKYSTAKKHFSKPAQVYFGKSSKEFMLDSDIFPRYLQAVNYYDVDTSKEAHSINLIVRGNSAELNKIVEVLRGLLERDRITVNKANPLALNLVLSSSARGDKLGAYFTTIKNDLDSQKKSAKFAALVSNNVLFGTSLDKSSIKALKSDPDLDNAYAGALIDIDEPFLKKNYLDLSKAIHLAIKMYLGY